MDLVSSESLANTVPTLMSPIPLFQTWMMIRRWFGNNDFLLAVLGTNLIQITYYWLHAGLYMIVDLTGKPSWVTRYKVQQAKTLPVDRARTWKAVKTVLYNQIVLNIPLTVITYPLGQYMGSRADLPLPSVLVIIRDFIVFMIVDEIVFYYSHRFFHSPMFYKHVHKVHHEWTAPSGLIASYAHPLEHIFCNFPAEMAGPLLMGSHHLTIWLWLISATFITINNHSGYALPVISAPHFHDYHHEKFTGNYGALHLLDWLHGTDKTYRDTLKLKKRLSNGSLLKKQ